ncbi:MAG: hypothetical protein RLZZ324_1307 [Candidatus Parcubacteria bacterium]|jgi:ADP-ribosylglycohydrolase
MTVSNARTEPALLDRIRGCFIGLAVGDALGVPVENMTHEAILTATNGQGIRGYCPMLQPVLRDDAPQHVPGAWSDDTQLTLVTLNAIVRARGFDLRAQARGLVDAYESSTFGWGGTTRDAALELQAWFDTGGKLGRMPETPAAEPPPGINRGLGSGPAMKIAALSVLHLWANDRDVIWQPRYATFIGDAMALGLMTHSDPRASIASIALGFAMAHLGKPATLKDDGGRAGIDALNFANQAARSAERQYAGFRTAQPSFSSRLGHAHSLCGDEDALRKDINTGFSSLESVPFAIATAAVHASDFRKAVLTAVNAGQDADTTGSMVGAMVGANVGLQGIPEEWVQGLKDGDVIMDAADRLAQTVFHIQPRR